MWGTTIAAFVAITVLGAVQAGTNQWTTNGPYGGLVSVLAVDPQTPVNLYAAGFSGVFKSANGGASWARASNGIIDPSVDALVIDPVTPTTLYAGSVQGGSVVKSTDGAVTWTPLSAAPTLVVAMAIDPKTPATLYAARNQVGISKSIDGGTTWAPIGVATLPSFPTFKSLVIDPTTPSTIYAGEQSNGIYKSVDGGATWNPANTGFIGPIIQIVALAIDPTTPATLYATASTSGSAGLFKSIDSGAHWMLVADGNVATYNFFIQTVAVDPQTPATIYIGTANGTFKSINGGAVFTPIHTGMPTRFVRVIAINPTSSATVYAGTEDGMFATTNGGALWTAANSGLALTTVTALAVDPTTPTTIYAGTTLSGIFKSVDSGNSWVAVDTGIGATGNLACNVPSISSLAIDPNTPTTLYAGTQCTQQSGLLKSINGGASWTAVVTGVPEFVGITAVAIDPLATSTIYAGSTTSGLFKSIDSAASWHPANAGLLDGAHITGLSIAVLPAGAIINGRSPRVGVAGTGNRLPTPRATAGTSAAVVSTDGSGAIVSTDQFETGQEVDDQDCINSLSTILALAQIDRTDLQIEQACRSPDSHNGVVLGYGIIVNVSSTKSVSKVKLVVGAKLTFVSTPWAPPDGDNAEGTACSPVFSIVGNPFDDTSFYAGAACGVLMGTNLGQQLVEMNAGLPTSLQVNALATSPTRIALYAGATSGGVYQFTFGPQAPTQLGITNVNGGANPVAATLFNVVITAQAADFSPQNVAAATTVQLSVNTGVGALGGTTACQIPAGSSSCTVTGVTYSEVDTGVVLTATRTAGDTLTPGNSAPFDVVAVGPPPSFVSAASRKVHGSAGTFDLPLSAVTTNPTTEPRIGPTQTIVFTFDKPIIAATAAITEGTATAAAPTFSGNDVIVGLTDVTDQQYVTIALTNVASSDGGTGGSGSVRLGFLLGDVNQNRVVSLADLGLVNAQLAQVVTAANYLKDVNASGTLSLADKGITNANLTRALPAP